VYSGNFKNMSDSELTVVNLVANGDLWMGEVDTDQIANDIDVEECTSLPGRIYLRSEEYPTVTIYRSGKFSVAGADSKQEAFESLDWLLDSLRDLGIELSRDPVRKSFSVEYLVLQGSLGQKVKLSKLMEKLGPGEKEYEPEQFPALIFKPSSINCTATIFSTGEVTITGVRGIETGTRVFDKIREKYP
jgi:transcription initiation factor TFIID TATA-box-binding protein